MFSWIVEMLNETIVPDEMKYSSENENSSNFSNDRDFGSNVLAEN